MMPESPLRTFSKLTLTLAEARRAFYLDFEGPQDAPPSFAGLRYDDDDGSVHFEQTILEDGLRATLTLEKPVCHWWPKGFAARDGGEAQGAQVRPQRVAASLGQFIRSLVERAEHSDRLIVSWSSHEATVVCSAAEVQDDIQKRFIARWRDGKRTCKRWRRVQAQGASLSQGHQLKQYLRMVGYDVPAHFGDRQASARIAAVRKQIAVRPDASRLTAVAKAKWTKVLDYNWHDCNGLRELTIIASGATPKKATATTAQDEASSNLPDIR